MCIFYELSVNDLLELKEIEQKISRPAQTGRLVKGDFVFALHAKNKKNSNNPKKVIK